ncbi:MAG: ABC transporter ATP-binding protein, partial [Proteobacteria bacterium]|nr:ABC transporter ATP-binding protein [Pseudomonadota bacterium]
MTGPGAAVVAVNGLYKNFGGVHAVDGITFTVEPGTMLGILGGNGAGKTTTIAMLLGLLVPDAGTISVLGQDMLADRTVALAQMNFSSPYVDLPKRLTVRENLLVYGRLYGLVAVPARIDELVRELNLGAFVDRPTGSLSAGQSTRVSLAKSLLNQPKL